MSKTKAFRIIDGNSLNCKFHLISNDLRSEASSFGLIPSRYALDDDELGNKRKVQKIERESIFSLVDLAERIESASENISDLGGSIEDEEFQEFWSALKTEAQNLSKLSRDALAQGQLPWRLIPHAFAKGDQVVVNTDDTSHGAEILRVSVQESFFGNYAEVALRFFAFDGKKFRWANASKRIPAYEGVKSSQQMGIDFIGQEAAAKLEQRGRRYIELCSAPSYSQYEGSLARRSWMGDQRFRAAGRIMVDARSMRVMDPDYHQYYGSFDRDDDDEGLFEQGQSFDSLHARLASPYVYGFSFLCKAWGEMLVDKVCAIEFRKDAFDQLVLDPKRKTLIEALVSQNRGGFSDLIEGKGGGCIFLLHGQPGVGKTLTAEAIAERLERPLYMVGAGELGVTPDELEERLKAILDTAHAWNAVLLIDEADIFLEKRAKSDVTRNALVGIFLRLLEYHQGILFLTTNRVADIDEAALNRVSVGLHYKPLAESDRSLIWRNLIAASSSFNLPDIDFQELGRLDVNGRQIKHCIRMSLAMAESQGRKPTQEDLLDMAALAREFKEDFKKASDNHS